MPPKEAARAWTETEEDKMLTWLEDHRHVLTYRRKDLAKTIKEEVFPSTTDLNEEKINFKIGNMKRSYKDTKKKLRQSGFGIPEGASASTISAFLNKKCHWYERLDDLYGSRSVEEDDQTQQTQPTQTTTQTQPTQPPSMSGDSISGCADIPRPGEPVDEDTTMMNVDGHDTFAAPGSPPYAVSMNATQGQQQGQQETSQTVQDSTAEGQGRASTTGEASRKRKRRGEDLEDVMLLVDRRIDATKEAAIEASREQTQRHEATMKVLNQLIKAQEEQAKRHDALWEKLMEKLG